MYEPFFSLHEPPFSLTPDPRFLWLSDTHEEGLSSLIYAISRRKGFMLLTGEVGAGKTTLLRAVLERIAADELDVAETALVMNTADLGARDLLKLIAADFRIEVPSAGEAPVTADYVIALNTFLIRRLRSGLNTVLVIDEAQNLGTEALEQVRLLSNLETNSQKMIQIILTGQPELRHKLMSPQLRQLRQRIAVDHHVAPLPRSDVGNYLNHRIQIAGGRFENVFVPGCESIFADFSDGIPRLINQLADRSLLAAFSRKVRPVPAALVELKAKQIADLQAPTQ